MKKLIYIIIAFGIMAGIIYPKESVKLAGTTVAIFQGGTGTTTAPVSQLLYGGTNAYQSVATTSASCSGNASCSVFTVIGSAPITISSALSALSPNSIAAFNGSGVLIATGTQLTIGNLLSTTTATSTFAGPVGIATTTFNGDFGIGPRSANASSTVAGGKLQWDGYTAGGVRMCFFFITNGVLATSSGACNL